MNLFGLSIAEFFSGGRLTFEWQWFLWCQVATILTPLVIFDASLFILLLLEVRLMALSAEGLHSFTFTLKLSPSLRELGTRLDIRRW